MLHSGMIKLGQQVLQIVPEIKMSHPLEYFYQKCIVNFTSISYTDKQLRAVKFAAIKILKQLPTHQTIRNGLPQHNELHLTGYSQ